MQFEYIETERLKLRKITPQVMEYVYNSLTDDETMAFFGLTSIEALEKERFKFRNGLATFNKSYLNFIIIDKQTNRAIGSSGYHTWYLDHNRAEIGYALYDDTNKRKGYMSEAVAAILAYGFTEMKLYRIEAMVADYNTASVRILEKFGFVHEGRLREHYNVNGKMEDSVLYGLLKKEFRG